MMPFFFYLLKVILSSGLLFGYYWFVLRNQSFHQWNRFYLLAITLLSLSLPLIKISISFKDKSAQQVVRYISLADSDASIVTVVKPSPLVSFSPEHWITAFYIAISGWLLLMAIKAAKGIVNIIKSHPKQRIDHLYFLQTEAPGTPFSFFNYLVWNQKIDLQSRTGQHIFRHEMAHITQRHTIDKILLLTILILFWLNPFFWMIRQELNVIHEFIADKKAVESGSTEDLSKMILNALYPQHQYLFASPFFQSSVKRRLQMFSLNNQKINYMSRILVLPLVVVLTTALTLQQDAAANDTQAFNTLNGVQKKADTFLQPAGATKQPDTVPAKGAKGVLIDAINKIYLQSDEIINRSPQNEMYTGPQNALLIVNGKKVDNSIWREKTIVAKKLVVYPKNDQEAIQLYGDEAVKGTFVFIDAKVINKAESALYKEMEGPNAANQQTVLKTTQPIFTKTEIEAKFPADPGWQAFLQKNLDAATPVNNGAPAGTYVVSVQFIVDVDGKLSDVKALSKNGYGMEEAVLKLMALSPNWEPAVQNGRKVKSYKTQKVTFVVSEDEEQIISANDKLYIGIDNPIKLDVGNPEPQNLVVSISDGSITKSGTIYIARVNRKLPVTIKVGIDDKGKLKPLSSRTFDADVIEGPDEGKRISEQIKKFNN